METLMIILIGVLVSVATYFVLSRNVTRVILGTALLSHAVHLLILTIGEVKKGEAPLLGNQTADDGGRYVDGGDRRGDRRR